MAQDIRPGIYNIEYFSGAQTAIYIGDIWVDEITSMSYSVSQSRVPLYGYADMFFRTVAKGQVLVQGTFTINFKEAGYLWLVLNHYQRISKNRPGKLKTPFQGKDEVERRNIEQIVNGEPTTFARNQALQGLVEGASDPKVIPAARAFAREAAAADLLGYAEVARSKGQLATAENVFEAFEDAIWQDGGGKQVGGTIIPQESDRRADDPDLNPFDIYVSFGDFAGDNRNNHTIQKISNVHILGSAKQIVIDGQPIQEQYTFIGQNLV